MTGTDAAIDVAVGVVIRGDARVLLGQRVAGKPYAGWWEFPGGKVEPGETVAYALARELHEELGIEVLASHPWVVREFSYPHAKVRLHFRRVFDFAGAPSSREGQAFAWVRSDARVECAPLLPATVPVFGWLRLPGRCLDCAQACPDPDTLRASLRDPAIVLLDSPTVDPDSLEGLFYRFREIARGCGSPLLVGARYPRSYAQAADGVVLDAHRLRQADARPHARLVAARCETAADLAHAARIGADLAIGSAQLVRRCASSTGIPLFSSGRLVDADPTDLVRAASRIGAHGLALPAAQWLEPGDQR